jgi:hypothetical protein
MIGTKKQLLVVAPRTEQAWLPLRQSCKNKGKEDQQYNINSNGVINAQTEKSPKI